MSGNGSAIIIITYISTIFFFRKKHKAEWRFNTQLLTGEFPLYIFFIFFGARKKNPLKKVEREELNQFHNYRQ